MKIQRICFTLKEVDTAIWVEGKKVYTQVGEDPVKTITFRNNELATEIALKWTRLVIAAVDMFNESDQDDGFENWLFE